MTIENVRQLSEIYLNDNQDVLDQLEDLMRSYAEDIIDVFYSELLDDVEAKQYLDHEVVEQRLKRKLVEWLPII